MRAVSTLQLPLLSDLGPGLSQVGAVVEEGGGGGWRGRGRGRSGSGQAVRAVRSAISVPCRGRSLERIPVLSSACSLLLASYGAGIMASVSACVGPQLARIRGF